MSLLENGVTPEGVAPDGVPAEVDAILNTEVDREARLGLLLAGTIHDLSGRFLSKVKLLNRTCAIETFLL